MHLNQSLASLVTLVVNQYKYLCVIQYYTPFLRLFGSGCLCSCELLGHAALLVNEQLKTLREDADCFWVKVWSREWVLKAQSRRSNHWWWSISLSTFCLIWAAVVILHNKTVKVFLNAPLMHHGAFIDLRREIHFLQSERWATKSSSSGVSNLLISGFVTAHPFWLIHPDIPKHFWPRRGIGFHYWFKYCDLCRCEI